VGLIGIGRMGHGMGLNVLKKFPDLMIYDKFPDSDSVLDLKKQGATVASSIQSLLTGCNFVITMVPGPKDVSDLYFQEILPHIPHPITFVDCSTIDTETSHTVREAVLKITDCRFFDAPVSGGIQGAKNGTLTFMVGCDDSQAAEIDPVLCCMGKIVCCGGPGKGTAVKICNNLILASTMLAVSESFRLAKSLGVDLNLFQRIVNMSSGKCWSNDSYNPVPGLTEGAPAGNDYKGGFATELMVKDLSLARDTGKKLQINIPITEFSLGQYQEVVKQGHGKEDFSCVYKYL
jgi:3-hydroxyisobutyrate dehydrogenase